MTTKMEDKLFDNNRWNKMQPVSAFRMVFAIISRAQKNSACRKIEFLLVSIDSKRTNSTRDCIYRRSKAATPHWQKFRSEFRLCSEIV